MLNGVNLRRIRTLAFLSVLALGSREPAVALPIMHLDIAGQGNSAVVGQAGSFVITVLASGIPPGSDGNGMFGFGFVLSFNAPDFTATTPSPEAQWTGFSSSSSGAGSIGLTANRFGETTGPSGDGIVLATNSLTPLSLGDFSITLSHFTGPGDNLLFDGTFLDGTSSFFESAQVTVPEPTTSMLLVLGGFAHLGWAWRKARAAQSAGFREP